MSAYRALAFCCLSLRGLWFFLPAMYVTSPAQRSEAFFSILTRWGFNFTSFVRLGSDNHSHEIQGQRFYLLVELGVRNERPERSGQKSEETTTLLLLVCLSFYFFSRNHNYCHKIRITRTNDTEIRCSSFQVSSQSLCTS